MSCHVFGERGLTNFDAELEEFTMDAGAPHSGLEGIMARISWLSVVRVFGKGGGLK